jgi:predicted transcriptional regulator of viral defense system
MPVKTKNSDKALREWLDGIVGTDDATILEYIQDKARKAFAKNKKFDALPTIGMIMEDLKVGHTKARAAVARLQKDGKIRRVREGRKFKIIPCEV